MIFYGKTFAEKQLEQRGRDYPDAQREIKRLRAQLARLRAKNRRTKKRRSSAA